VTQRAAKGSPWGSHAPTKTVAFVSVAQDPNEEFRSYMEDGHFVVDPFIQRGSRGKEDQWGYFGVYDGHGGRQEVEYVEAKLHEVVLAELQSRSLEKGVHQPVHDALTSAFHKIDGQLAMLGAWNSGCTCTVALAHRHASGLTVHVANVGDSRAVIVGSTSAKRLSVDHRAGDAEEAKRVVAEGGIVRHGRVGGQLSVSRSLGDHHLKSSGVSCVPDITSYDVGENHALVIASDGLWDALEDDDAGTLVQGCIDSAVSQGGGPEAVANCLREDAARTLVERAKERGSRDNILALVAFF
jgi:serine/threonine protein phosphatase PrpC